MNQDERSDGLPRAAIHPTRTGALDPAFCPYLRRLYLANAFSTEYEKIYMKVLQARWDERDRPAAVAGAAGVNE